MKKLFALCLSLLLVCGVFAACSDDVRKELTEDTTGATEAPAAATQITALLGAPAQAAVWEEITAAYQKQTGVRVRVTTVSADTYPAALAKQLKGDDAPAIFEWVQNADDDTVTDAATDLAGTGFASFLADASLAVRSGGKVRAVPVDVSAFGILYNEALTDRYFALENKGTSYSSMAEINSFEKLRTLAEDIQKHKAELGIDGAFAAPAFKGEEGKRWQSEVANTAVVREASATDGALDDIGAFLKNTFDFTYSSNVRDLLDLTAKNADVDAKTLAKRTEADARNAFRQGKAVFLFDGTDASDALFADGGTLKATKVKLLPLYLGADGEETQGLSVRTERALAVNDKADADKKQAAVDFLEWLFSSEEGKRFVSEKLRLRAPFSSFDDNERVSDPLARTALSTLGKNDRESVPEVLDRVLPTEGFENVSNYLLSYLRGERGWDDLMRDVRARWDKMWADGTDLIENDNGKVDG